MSWPPFRPQSWTASPIGRSSPDLKVWQIEPPAVAEGPQVAAVREVRCDAMGAKSQLEVPTRLRIGVVGATGTGPTSLAAFDDALRAVGVANFNLIRLSSVIPPGSRVTAGSRGAARREGEGSAEVVDLRESNGS